MKPQFRAGNNIAMKIPPHEYQQTLRFYRDVIGLKPLPVTEEDATPRFEFGDKILWLDKISGLSQAEIWLEILTDDMDNAARFLSDSGVVRCDEIEPLPDGFKGFWVANPGNIIHLICESDKLN
ncbi:hypothetical protein [Lacimicrobium alkaliphilum]|uniref:VOC domain-containing protein n=1 Tax=Lacimicrobium alkaliphilum TaxID=1526571 RepID=A0ABQ1RQ37_9ALTE|nr:hypothetical protein [Lacimicrobium alkaliphilum]GGD74517.1 hypothetical protein GCM10011357_31940 [Lacimicrobium alkaliphilum]